MHPLCTPAISKIPGYYFNGSMTLQANRSVMSVVKLSGEKIASGSLDKTIKIWNPNTGECLLTLEEHTDVVESIVKLSDGNIASCSWDKTIKIWESKDWEVSSYFKGT